MELSRILALLSEPGCTGVLATLVHVQGSSYRRPGARLLWRPGQGKVGAISGGCLEADIVAQCELVHRTGRSRTLVYDTSKEEDMLWGVGLGCHGTVQVALEPVGPGLHRLAKVADAWTHMQPAYSVCHYNARGVTRGTLFAGRAEEARTATMGDLSTAVFDRCGNSHLSTADGELFVEYHALPHSVLIAGAGDDAIPLAQMAAMLGWRVSVADFRTGYATRERFPTAAELLEGPPERLLADKRLHSQGFVVIMTHHYLHDIPWLRTLSATPRRYLGLLGPKSRAERILSDLEREGYALPNHAATVLHAPVGLDLGGDGAEAVALAIMAEMQAASSGRDGGALRLRQKPIHADPS